MRGIYFTTEDSSEWVYHKRYFLINLVRVVVSAVAVVVVDSSTTSISSKNRTNDTRHRTWLSVGRIIASSVVVVSVASLVICWWVGNTWIVHCVVDRWLTHIVWVRRTVWWGSVVSTVLLILRCVIAFIAIIISLGIRRRCTYQKEGYQTKRTNENVFEKYHRV